MSMEGAIIPRTEDALTEYVPPKKRRGRASSVVWEHFDKIKEEIGDSWKTQCKHCKQIYSSAQKNGTSHLKRHMDRCPKLGTSGLSLPTMSAIVVKDRLLEYESSNKRSRLISKVWEDFEKLKAERDDILKAQCRHCKQILSGASKHGTSHLKRHLERCSKRKLAVRQLLLSTEVQNIKQLLDSSEALSDGSMPWKKGILDRNGILKAISTFVVCGKHPVTVIQGFGFRHLMSIVCPESVNVSTSDIKRDIISSYLKERDNIKELLGKAPGKVCLACENWCSEYSKDEYLCITAHFTDDDWKVHKKIICLKTLVPPFDGSLLAEEIALCLKQWKIVSKIFSITSDNASYDDSMVSSLKRCFLSKKNLSIDATFFQVQCCCQILNHIVQTSLNLADDVIDKIRSGVKYIRKLIWRKKKFYEIAAKEFHLDTKRRLQLDVCYCWNTTYMMLESAFYYKGMLQYWGEHDVSFRCYMLSEEEWEKVSLLQKFLAVFYDVEYMFSVTQHPTSNLYFRALWKVHMHLLKAARGPYSFMTGMVRDMQERFEKYWMNHNLILSCAAVLDPRYKVKLIEFCYTKVCGDKADVLVNHTVRTLYVLFDEYKLNSMASSSCSRTSAVPAVAEHGNVDGDEFEDYELFLSRKSRPQEEKSQLDLYLEEPSHELNSDVDVLEYWNKSSMRYPELAMMARDMLTIPISTVAPEASFNIRKNSLHAGQISPNPKMTQALVCLLDWTYPTFEKSSVGCFSIPQSGDHSTSDEEDNYDDCDTEEVS